MPPELTEVREWLRKADHDRGTAETLMALSKPITDTAAFHCQQAVEKSLKAYLVWKEFEFEKLHDLERLIDDCGRYDNAFLSLKPRVASITAYAVRFRYPGPADPSVEEVKEALQVVAAVRKFVADRLPPEVVP